MRVLLETARRLVGDHERFHLDVDHQCVRTTSQAAPDSGVITS
ncbi:hypothetical protein ACIHFD_48270 [Nonomuraea sp. NPDC051941]